MLLGVDEPLSGSVLTAGSPEIAGINGDVVSSFTSISVLDWDWRMALPFEARTYRSNTIRLIACAVVFCIFAAMVVSLVLMVRGTVFLLLPYLVELSLCLSQSDLVLHHLSLHLLVVCLKCANQMAHLPVNRT